MSTLPADPQLEAARATEPIDPVDPSARTVGWLRLTIGLATLIMLGLSWPLWVSSDEIPRVPFVKGMDFGSTIVTWASFAILIAAMIGTPIAARWRSFLALSVAIFAALVAQDQHRFQPWVYQYMVVGFLLFGLPPGRALEYARWWFVSIYAYSGLSKIDRSFCDELGRVFLETAVRPFGITSEAWPEGWRIAAILAMPAAEIAVAVMLCLRGWRWPGLAGALLLHIILLALLGPWGLGHSTIVLVWNVAMMVELAILFGSKREGSASLPDDRPSLLERFVIVAFWIAVVAPLGERWGWLDSWPAHALYASHAERTWVEVPEEALEQYPDVIRRHCVGEGSWRRLDLTGWSREVRGVPVYPQGRACNGLAEALAARYGEHRSIRVIQWGRAEAWSGRRSRSDYYGLDAIRHEGDRYWLNAHPSATALR